MSKKEVALRVLLEQKILPLYYHASAATSVDALRALYGAGIRTVEYTNRGDEALGNFRALRGAVDESMPGLLLGIGTIKNEEQADAYIAAGADYIVCPSTHPGVAARCASAGLLWIPGCMTPTEIAAAENAGARLVKIFPGNLLGPSYVSSVKDLFPGLLFMPTGGVEVNEANLAAWFGAGVSAVGMGSKLVTRDILQQGDWETLRKTTVKALELVRAAAKQTS